MQTKAKKGGVCLNSHTSHFSAALRIMALLTADKARHSGRRMHTHSNNRESLKAVSPWC